MHAVDPPREERTSISATHYIGSLAEPEVPIYTIIDYYFALRVLTNVWAFVGNWEIAPGKKFMDKTTAQNYADDTLRWTSQSGLANHEMLPWYRTRDVATRSKMMEYMRQPPRHSAADALKLALDFMRSEWNPARLPVA